MRNAILIALIFTVLVGAAIVGLKMLAQGGAFSPFDRIEILLLGTAVFIGAFLTFLLRNRMK